MPPFETNIKYIKVDELHACIKENNLYISTGTTSICLGTFTKNLELYSPSMFYNFQSTMIKIVEITANNHEYITHSFTLASD
jgi:hypothetical protein